MSRITTLRHTIWITGLSKSGKTTVAEGIEAALRESGQQAHVLDGRTVRESLGNIFGYSKQERMKVSRVLCTMAKTLATNGVIPIVTSITPHQESRDFNRRELDLYLELYLDCPVEVCIERDVEGLYRKAINGDIEHFIGVDDVYEVPRTYDCRIDTAALAPDEAIAAALSFIDAEMGRA